MYTALMQDWDTDIIRHSPLFGPLHDIGVLSALWRARQWPSLAELQALVDASGVLSGGGQPLRLVLPDARAGAFEDRYEVRIHREGELPMRSNNWHDLFNLLVWILFPRSKAAINARHYQALLARQSAATLNRGPAQDTLTLFDESGVVVVANDPALLQQVRDFAWQDLFWRHREDARRQVRWFVFGHALYEKALSPYVGMTGQGVLVTVADEFHAWPAARQLAFADEVVARRIADPLLFCATSELAPVPVLGVPGWWPANDSEMFYDNKDYFRTGRRTRPGTARRFAG